MEGAASLPYSSEDQLTIPATSYIQLPFYQYPIGEEVSLWAVSDKPYTTGVFKSGDVLAGPVGFTLEEDQSYSAVFISESMVFNSEQWDYDPIPVTQNVPSTIFVFEERPNPSPVNKALLKIVNIAVSTYGSNMNATLSGTAVASREVTVGFGQDSGFLVYNADTQLILRTTLPAAYLGDEKTVDREITFTIEVNYATIVYIRGDIADTTYQGGHLIEKVNFTFPAAPTATPINPPSTAPKAEPTSEPSIEPTTEPTTEPEVGLQPESESVPTSNRVPTRQRVPVSRVSATAQSIALFYSIVSLASLLLF